MLKAVIGCEMLLIGLLFFSSCATQKINYPIENMQNKTKTSFSGKSLAVKMFIDDRTLFKQEKNGKNRKIENGNTTWFFNNTNQYKDKNVSLLITQMIAKHLNATNIFKLAEYQNGDTYRYDYILDGTIKEFSGFKEESTTTEIGAAFGLLGALATSNVQSRYKGTTILVNMTLRENKTNRIIWNGDIQGDVEGSDYADADGWSAYEKANLSLKEAVNKLIKILENIQ
jgi:hypothetical protein